ncbi:ATP-binding protein [Nocardiopsis sp. NPDC058789]
MCETAAPRSAPTPPLPTASAPLHRPQRPASPMEESSSAPPTTECRHVRRRFPGLPSQIAYARRFVARQLAVSPEVTTATLLTSELATNAITHSDSGRATGKFEVCVRHAPGWARVEVRDLGSTTEAPAPQHRDPYDTAEHGRGLDLVEALASKWGTEPRRDGRGRQVWFELVWDGDDRGSDQPR